MIGWTVNASSRSGCAGCGSGCARRARSVSGASRRHRRPRLLVVAVLGRVAGERQEHVVERRALAAPMSSTRDAGVVEPAHRLDDRAVRRARPAAARAPSSSTAARVAIGASAATAASRLRRRRQVDLQPLAADAVLELVGRAVGDHACRGRSRRCGRRAGRPRRGTASSAAPSFRRRRGPRSSPTAQAAARVEARSSARRGTAPAAARRAPPRGRAGGACRPSRSWPGDRRRRRGRSARAARAPRALGVGAARAVQAPDHRQVLARR